MEVFFPVSEEERDALVRGDFEGSELTGQDRLASDPAGVDDDAVWVAAEVDKQVAESHEDPDGPYLGYRPFTFPRDRLNNFSWRVVGEQEVTAARQAEAEVAEASRRQARAEAKVAEAAWRRTTRE